jgi:hypothetical protein
MPPSSAEERHPAHRCVSGRWQKIVLARLLGRLSEFFDHSQLSTIARRLLGFIVGHGFLPFSGSAPLVMVQNSALVVVLWRYSIPVPLPRLSAPEVETRR